MPLLRHSSAERSLIAVLHYHQRPNVHPVGHQLPGDAQRVELLTAGRGWVERAGEWVEVTAGALLWHGQGDSTIGRSDFNNPYRCLAVAIRVPLGTPRPVERFSVWSNLDEVHAFTGEAVRRYVDSTFPRDILCEYLYSTLRYRSEVGIRKSEVRPPQEPLRRALQLIETNYRKRLSLPTLAKHAGWSVAHLNEMCRLYLKQTLHQVLTVRRLKAACEQLIGTNKPIKAIALDCGFSHSAAFCDSFRRAYSMTPGDYRNRVQLGLPRAAK